MFKISKVTFLACLLSSSLIAKQDFIFSENPDNYNVHLQKASYLFSSRLLASLDAFGRSVEMDDGSIWRIDDNVSAQTVQSWFINDALIICPAAPSYAGAPRFFIYNQMSKTSAFAEPSIKPTLGKITTNLIQSVDYNSRQMRVIDGMGRVTYWLIDYNDYYKLQTWRTNQLIVIGYNQNFTSRPVSSLPYILINMDKNEFVYAHLQ